MATTREKPDTIREMGVDQIHTEIATVRENLFHLRFQNTMKQLNNPLTIRESRRRIARLLTVLKEKERAGL